MSGHARKLGCICEDLEVTEFGTAAMVLTVHDSAKRGSDDADFRRSSWHNVREKVVDSYSVHSFTPYVKSWRKLDLQSSYETERDPLRSSQIHESPPHHHPMSPIS